MGGVHQPWEVCISHGRGASAMEGVHHPREGYIPIGVVHPPWEGALTWKGCIAHGRGALPMGGVHHPWEWCISHGRGTIYMGAVQKSALIN